MENKQYYITIDNEQIPVTEEVYRAYKRPEWAEHKRFERSKRCVDSKGRRCTADCSKCPRARTGSVLSLDKLAEDGFDVGTSAFATQGDLGAIHYITHFRRPPTHKYIFVFFYF